MRRFQKCTRYITHYLCLYFINFVVFREVIVPFLRAWALELGDLVLDPALPLTVVKLGKILSLSLNFLILKMEILTSIITMRNKQSTVCKTLSRASVTCYGLKMYFINLFQKFVEFFLYAGQNSWPLGI